VRGTLEPVATLGHCKQDFGPFTSYGVDGHRVSFLGDTHPVFHGSVVKAVASAQKTYPKIVATFGDRAGARGTAEEYQAFRAKMQDRLAARVERVERLGPGVVELTVRAPQAAAKFRAGQFFRVQTFETHAPVVDNTPLQTEPLALYGGQVDKDQGTIAMIVMENGASSRVIATLKPGDPIACMGPTGVRAFAAEKSGETYLYIGGVLGAAQFRSVGAALRAGGNRVLYVGAFDAATELNHRDALEAAADAVLWVTRQGAPIAARRPQDRSYAGDVIDALVQYASGALGEQPIAIRDVTRLWVSGSSRLVRRVRDARARELAPFLVGHPMATASVSTPMQCMLKGVCSQCLQWQIDPHTGRRTKAVFSCSWQDQPLDIVDLDNLDERLSQNRVQEHLTNLWLDHLFESGQVARV
jgi:NAD(P)H-flavin reductase